MATRTCKLIFVFVLLNSCIWAQQSGDKGEQIIALFQMLENYHYNPPVCDNKLSNTIFNHFIKTLDPHGLLFTDENIESLDPYRDSLCNENPVTAEGFINEMIDLYRKRLLLANALIDSSFNTPFDFSKQDSLLFYTSDSLVILKNDPAGDVRWKKWIKYGMLKGLMLSGNDSTFSGSHIPDTLVAAGSLLANKTRLREKRRISQLLDPSGGFESFVQNTFLKTVTACYDPHSAFFSNYDKEKFESSLSKENYAFGFELGSNLNEEIIISKILPESPVWYSKKLKKGDVLMALKIPGQETIDLTFTDLFEIDDILQNLEKDRIELTVRKINGVVDTIALRKGKFDTKQNRSAGFMLNGIRRVGYIWFSQFYTELGQTGNTGCSTDVLREIVKLREEGAEGLILDLRSNPGGSEYEALKIAGFLIGKGPLGFRVNKAGEQVVLENDRDQQWYDRPVTVLVNATSASAAEQLAAMLQDYNRAVIIGSPTFGKASEQVILPLGKKFRPDYGSTSWFREKDIGFVKLTLGKIFRITGASYQKTGLVPDVVLPDLVQMYGNREAELPFALENDSILPETAYTPFPKLPVDTLEKLSSARVGTNEKFQQMIRLNDTLKTVLEDSPIPLHYLKFKAETEKRRKLIADLEFVMSADTVPFEVLTTAFDTQKFETDSLTSQLNGLFRNAIKKDIYISEAYSVVVDLIEQGKEF